MNDEAAIVSYYKNKTSEHNRRTARIHSTAKAMGVTVEVVERLIPDPRQRVYDREAIKRSFNELPDTMSRCERYRKVMDIYGCSERVVCQSIKE